MSLKRKWQLKARFLQVRVAVIKTQSFSIDTMKKYQAYEKTPLFKEITDSVKAVGSDTDVNDYMQLCCHP